MGEHLPTTKEEIANVRQAVETRSVNEAPKMNLPLQ